MVAENPGVLCFTIFLVLSVPIYALPNINVSNNYERIKTNYYYIHWWTTRLPLITTNIILSNSNLVVSTRCAKVWSIKSVSQNEQSFVKCLAHLTSGPFGHCLKNVWSRPMQNYQSKRCRLSDPIPIWMWYELSESYGIYLVVSC